MILNRPWVPCAGSAKQANWRNAMADTQPPSRSTPRTERRARHILDNYYIGPARDADVLEIWAYTDRFSYEPGQTVDLHVSTTADTWHMEIGRDGSTYEPVMTLDAQRGIHHDTPPDCSVQGCGWPVSHTFTVPEDWQPGMYLITLTAFSGSETIEEHHMFFVRRQISTDKAGTDNIDLDRARILLVCATGTWVAYNDWGGSNAYQGITGENGDEFSPVLSTQRPWTRGFCKLPPGAPRTVPDTPGNPEDMVRYPYMEWAYAYGYSKKYASAGWATYERHFAHWAEQNGYALDYATLHDIHDDPDLLSPYPCAVFVGHDEYWTAQMRDAVDTWVDAGGRAARFAGNFLWQVRLEKMGATQVCYKYVAADRDPVMGTSDQHALTGAWEMPEVDRPGAQTFGVNALEGMYAGFGNCVGRGAGGFTIYRPEHWAFEGSNVAYGDVLGVQSRIFGYEVDGLDYEIKGGLPSPTGHGGAPDGLQILGMGIGTNAEANHGIWGETLYIKDDDGLWKAQALLGDVSPDVVARACRGSGMIVHFTRGRGEVFTAATCEWVMGLTRGDKQVERITRNVLDKFSS